MLETRKTFGDVSIWPSGDLVATVEIGRPPDNFFDAGLITSLADACAWLDEQPEFRAAVLCSDGKRALDLLCTGRRVGGEEAARIGLADRLANPDGLRAVAQELAAEIAAAAPLAVRSIRATMRGTLADRARAAMARELAEQDQLRQTADFAEGVRASAQRRPPRLPVARPSAAR
jgi:enoyl-CoA hydratase/carnithine racemase